MSRLSPPLRPTDAPAIWAWWALVFLIAAAVLLASLDPSPVRHRRGVGAGCGGDGVVL